MTQPTVPESTEGSSSPKDRLQSHQVHLTVLQAYTCIQYIHKNESKHSEMGPVRQNPMQRTVRPVRVCALHCAQLLHTILHRKDLIIFPHPLDNHHCSDDVYLREGGTWYREWNYGTFADGATYIWLGSHHVGQRPTF